MLRFRFAGFAMTSIALMTTLFCLSSSTFRPIDAVTQADLAGGWGGRELSCASDGQPNCDACQSPTGCAWNGGWCDLMMTGQEGCAGTPLSKMCEYNTVTSSGCTQVANMASCMPQSPFLNPINQMGCLPTTTNQCVAAGCFPGGSFECPGCD